MRLFTFFIGGLLLFISCGKNNNQQAVDRLNNSDRADTLSIADISADTTKAMIATLPVYFDSTRVLIQPTGLISIDDINKNTDIMDALSYARKLRKDSYTEPDFYVNSIIDDHLSGKMSNLYFDDYETNQRRLLTNKIINISDITYLRKIAKKTDRHYLLYSVYDKDSNRDGKLNRDDILALYISNLDGTKFQKITKENHKYMNEKLISFASRYYFTTIEDINRDGKFSKGDKYYYYYIDFANSPYTVVEYNPLGN